MGAIEYIIGGTILFIGIALYMNRVPGGCPKCNPCTLMNVCSTYSDMVGYVHTSGTTYTNADTSGGGDTFSIDIYPTSAKSSDALNLAQRMAEMMPDINHITYWFGDGTDGRVRVYLKNKQGTIQTNTTTGTSVSGSPYNGHYVYIPTKYLFVVPKQDT